MTPWHHGTKYISWPNMKAVRLAFFCVFFNFVPIWEISPCRQPWWQLLCTLESTPPSSVDEFSAPPARNNYWARSCTIQLSLILADMMGGRDFNNILRWHLAQFFVTLFWRKDGKVILLRQSWKSAAKKPNFDISHPPSLSACLQPQQHKFNWYFWHYG